MATIDMIAPAETAGEMPVVRKLVIEDLKDALRKGFDDFKAMPSHVVFLSLIYPIVGLFIGRYAFGANIVPLLFPLAAGFALIGPFAAIGLYEMSRRRELGLDTSWRHALDVFHSPSLPGIAALGALLMAIFLIWLGVANELYVANFGWTEPQSLSQFARKLFSTREGTNLIVYGNLIGFLFALLAGILSVVSFPLLLDRHVGAATAALTSIKVVRKNPLTMAIWGLIIAVALVLGSLPLFFGLALVMPILGHATWHLYRKAVEPDTRSPRPAIESRPKTERSAADFPAALFSTSPRKAPSQKD